MNISIKKYTTEYNKQLISVWEQSVLSTHHFLDQKDFLEIKEFLQNFDFEILTIFCLVDDDELIGFIGLQESKIEMLFIHQQYFGKGLGRVLVDFAIRNFNANLVDVNEQNIPAKKFYEKLGFVVYEITEKDNQGKNYPLLKMRLENRMS